MSYVNYLSIKHEYMNIENVWVDGGNVHEMVRECHY